MRLGIVFGTRPEAIKLGPVVAALREWGVDSLLLCTGQHTTLLRGTPADSDLKDAISLDLPSTGKVGLWIVHAVPRLIGALQTHDCTHVAVQGDTMSAMAGAWAAHRSNLPLAHIEAGLRSHSLTEPWPEERIRVGIARIAQLHLAPTGVAMKNLLAEGISAERIRITGNSGVSALARYGNCAPCERSPFILITMHRREWLDSTEVYGVFEAFVQAAREHPDTDFLWPMHPNTLKHWMMGRFQGPGNCCVVDPVPYREMVGLLRSANGLITDSGGLQEEAATLGTPCAVLRNVSDRPESLAVGVAKRFSPTGEGFREGLEAIFDGSIARRPSTCYGTPEAASHIAQFLHSWLQFCQKS